ncbi:MAG: NADH-quinone oxidoreductase subunit C [Caldiserica bacterium]|jgi:Ni,Fe-hydrogenase III component G|nr:NADH-quinone oxidoreductase subunit C [Caldisericota bacterium]MDH7562060.1 NADH-quinone oxidoreductase subunit C [Caldisericota bacterium]
MWVEVSSSQIRNWVEEFIKSGKFRLLSTISGYEEGDKYFIVYHFLDMDGDVDVRTSVPKDNPVLPSISPVLPGGILYEREIQDLLGVKFEGIIDGRRLILPEHWPEGVYPLRKDFKPGEVKVNE